MDNTARGSKGLAPPATLATRRTPSNWSTGCGRARCEIANEMSTALGDVGAEKAMAKIAKQMQMLLASDVALRTGGAPRDQRRARRQRDRGRGRPAEHLPARGTVARRKPPSRPRSGRSAARQRRRNAGHPRASDCSARTSTATELAESTTTVKRRRRRGSGSQVEPGRIDRERRHRLGNGWRQHDCREHQLAAGETATALIPLTPTPKGTVTLEVERRSGAGRDTSPKTTRALTPLVE